MGDGRPGEHRFNVTRKPIYFWLAAMIKRPVLVVGAGGHAKVVIDVIRLLEFDILFATDIDTALHGTTIMGVNIAGADEHLSTYAPSDIYLANGVGAIASTQQRQATYEKYAVQGYEFLPLIHPDAVIAESAILSDGVQCMAGTIIQPEVQLGKNTVINTRASIDHDSEIGAHSFIGPGAVTGGSVKINAGAFIGTGAIILPSVVIGENAVVGAGATVTRDLCIGERVAGNPASSLRSET